jgi:hypothetical protein
VFRCSFLLIEAKKLPLHPEFKVGEMVVLFTYGWCFHRPQTSQLIFRIEWRVETTNHWAEF